MSNKIDLSDSSEQQGKPPINGVIILRIIAVEKKTSSNNNPMVSFQNEIVTETIKIEGEDRKIAGLRVFENIVFSANNSRFSKERMKSLNKCTGMPMIIDIDVPSELKPYIGKAYRAQVITKTEALKDGEGEPVLDDTGNVITDNNYKILRYIGKDEEHTIPAENVAF